MTNLHMGAVDQGGETHIPLLLEKKNMIMQLVIFDDTVPAKIVSMHLKEF